MICGKETHANGELLKSIIHTSKFVPAKSSAQTNTKGRYGTMLFASHTGWKYSIHIFYFVVVHKSTPPKIQNYEYSLPNSALWQYNIIPNELFVFTKSSAQTNTKGRYGTIIFASHTGWKTPNSALWQYNIIPNELFVFTKSSAQTNTKGRYGTMLFASHTGWKTPNSALWLSICLY